MLGIWLTMELFSGQIVVFEAGIAFPLDIDSRES